ncbi:MAG TPA: glycosyltransferase [Fimbriimonadaceae bacterium]|nr:glycosyltransferase [Fimbriimonadaceae bacterium]
MKDQIRGADEGQVGRSDENFGFVVLSHLRWSFVWQRPQQFLSRFAKDHPILFIEEPEYTLSEGEAPTVSVEPTENNITVARMKFPAGTPRDKSFDLKMIQMTEDLIATVNENGEFDKPLLWFYSPMESPWALQLDCRGVVYDCMDELSQFRFAPQALVDNEALLLSKADIVFTGGYELAAKKAKQHNNVHTFGCGVEYDHFSKAQLDETEIPEDVRDLKKPVVGWFGVVDERVDYDLIREAAEKRPDWSFVLVGPVVKVDEQMLPKAPNIHWLGQRDYKVLPNYCKAYDICMMCFALNEATEFINPTKALEYLATGKPVISTAVKDVLRQYSDDLYICKSTDEFIEMAERALAGKDQEMRARGLERAQRCSWESTVAEMERLIAEAIGAGSGEALAGAAG